MDGDDRLTTERMGVAMERRVWPRDYQDDATPPGHGIRCPKCGCRHWEITHSRPAAGGSVWRRRKCRHCGYVRTTYER